MMAFFCDSIHARPPKLLEEPTDRCLGEFPVWTISVEQIDEQDDRMQQRFWIGAHLESSVPWPTKPHAAIFEGYTLFILPHGDEYMASVFARYRDGNKNQVRETILRFCSVWSWIEQRGIFVNNWSEGSHMFRSKRHSPFRTIMDFPLEFDSWPMEPSSETRLALALYREGLSLRHAPYSFLSFFKIITILNSGNSGQRKMIKKYIPEVTEKTALERLGELGNFPDGKPIQDYIYQSGRSAVAHASTTKGNTVDPDNPVHERRLQSDLPIIKEIGRLIIVNEFGVPMKQDIWQSNTHYVQGAIWFLGKTDYERILSGNEVGRRGVNLPQYVDLRNKSKLQYNTLQNLKLTVTKVSGGIVQFHLTSGDMSMKLFLCIDFNKGRLIFDPLDEHQNLDDGTKVVAERNAEYAEFWAEVVGNGRCQIIESGTDRVIAEAQAYMPTNWYLNHEGSKADIENWRKIAAERDL
jgi:hypothetical protein